MYVFDFNVIVVNSLIFRISYWEGEVFCKLKIVIIVVWNNVELENICFYLLK